MSEEFVAVMVPKSRVLEVYALLGGQPSATPPSGSGSPPGGADTDEDRIKRAVSSYLGCSKKMRCVLNFMMDQPGVLLSYDTIEKGVVWGKKVTEGYTLMGTLGAFGTRKDTELSKPFDSVWDANENKWQYIMPKQVADALRKVRRNA